MGDLILPFSDQVLEAFRIKLRREWSEVRRRIERNLRDARVLADTDPGDDADRASEMEQMNRLYRAADRDRILIREIEAAMDRIDRGAFGVCEGSGRQIEPARLRARPWARYSHAHLSEIHRR